jgi:hypothetical protein
MGRMILPSKGLFASVEEGDLGLHHPLHKYGSDEELYSIATAQMTLTRTQSGNIASGTALPDHVDSAQSSQILSKAEQLQRSLTSESKVSEKYKEMLYEYDSISIKFNLSATFSLWLLLFGFVLFSGTFTTFKLDPAEKILISKIENIPMFVFGILFCLTASGALIFLSWRWKDNYIWLVERVLLYVPLIVS